MKGRDASGIGSGATTGRHRAALPGRKGGTYSQTDVIVIGGGFAGVLAAGRLAADGVSVTLLERGALGSGASVSNHGIIHSGAMYAQYHPDVLRSCQEAQALVRAEFPEAVIGVYPSVYYGHAGRLRPTVAELSERGVGWKPAHTLAARWPESAADAITVEETIVSPRHLLLDLVARAHGLGVRIVPWTAAARLERDRGCWLVGLPDGQKLRSRVVVLAAGAGSRRLLGELSPGSAGRIRSRLELMIYVPGRRLDRPVFCVDYGGPTLVPAPGGTLMSFHGAPRLDIDDGCGRPVPLARANQLLQAVAAFPNLADALADAVAYTCVKTEWTDGLSDRWGSRPEYAVIDHGAEGLPGLVSLFPGKMTLAFEATQELARLVLGRPVPLIPPGSSGRMSLGDVSGQVAVEPWRLPDSSARAS
jgi:glycine/D-amino acid oxidase-like deaminating enzyme